MKFINIFTNKGLREHDESIRNETKKEGIEQGIKEGNEKATKLWQKEFDNQINTANENKENMLEDISFNAGDIYPPVSVTIDAAYVKEHLKDTLKDVDLQKYIL